MSMTPLGSPVVPLENGSATTWRAGSIAGLGAGVPGGASRASNGVVPAAPPNVKTSSTPAHARRLDCSLGQHRSGHEKAGAGHAQLQRGLRGRVQPIDGRVRPAGAGNAVKRDGVLRHVGRVDADDLARREPACSQPGSTAIDVLGQLRIGQRCAGDGIDDRRPVATCGGVGEHEIGERDVRHVHVRVRAADRHRPAGLYGSAKWHTRRVSFGRCAAMIRA